MCLFDKKFLSGIAAVGVSLTLALVLTGCGGGGKSGNANLSILSVAQAALVPAFSPGVTSYTADVEFDVDTTTVRPVAASGKAALRVNGAAVASGSDSAAIALAVGDNTVTVVVTAENGATKTYVVTVRRAPDSAPELADLRLTVAELDQVFQPTLSSYTADVGFLGAGTRIVASTAAANAVIEVNGQIVTNGVPSDTQRLNVGGNDLAVAVSTSTSATRTYRASVIRAPSSSFSQRAYVKASNTDAGDRFRVVAIDADTMVIGAPSEASNAIGVNGIETNDTLQNAGAAYVFVRNGGTWRQDAYLKASNTGAGDQFGAFVAISGDTIAIGAPGEQSLAQGIGGNQADNSGTDVGAVYVFRRNAGGTWQQTAYVKASNAESGDKFGRVALHEVRLVVGALGEDSAALNVGGNQADNSQLDAGAAYVFERGANGAWLQTAYLKASNTSAQDAFGVVAVHGNTIAVGALAEDSSSTGVGGDAGNDNAAAAGAVYTFVKAGAVWSPEAYIKASNTDPGDLFGNVAIDGNVLVVGADGEDSNARMVGGVQSDNSAVNSGAAYVFNRSAGQWSQVAYLKSANSDANDAFGRTVRVWGNMIAVGATQEQGAATGIGGNAGDNTLAAAGAAYLFERGANGAWQQVSYVKASNTRAGDLFGESIALSRDTLAVGARGERSASTGINGNQSDESAAEAGAVYVYD